jgi:hypothetical protein
MCGVCVCVCVFHPMCVCCVRACACVCVHAWHMSLRVAWGIVRGRCVCMCMVCVRGGERGGYIHVCVCVCVCAHTRVVPCPSVSCADLEAEDIIGFV